MHDSTRKQNQSAQKEPRIRRRFHRNYFCTGKVLGKGATGTVRTYRQRKTKREYAVKEIQSQKWSVRQRAIKEISIYSQCESCENIMTLVDSFDEGDKIYQVFPKMNQTLYSLMENSKPLHEKDVSSIIKQLVSALDFLHQRGIAHRDVKPENILLKDSHSVENLVLCDFDLADYVCLYGNGILTMKDHVGTLDYKSPEVIATKRKANPSPYDEKVDMWSVGVILYEMLFKELPFDISCGELDCGMSQGVLCKECEALIYVCIMDGYYTFPPVKTLSVSDEAKDLISRLLVLDPQERLSADQVLNHPFITDYSIPSVGDLNIAG